MGIQPVGNFAFTTAFLHEQPVDMLHCCTISISLGGPGTRIARSVWMLLCSPQLSSFLGEP
jgi:hypothetical protein